MKAKQRNGGADSEHLSSTRPRAHVCFWAHTVAVGPHPEAKLGSAIGRLAVAARRARAHNVRVFTEIGPEVTDPRGRMPERQEDDVQAFWVYKRGQLVLSFSSAPGFFVPTRGVRADDDPAWYAEVAYASGQFMSVEWEPRVRFILRRATDLVDFIERLEDRRYEVDLEPPSHQTRPFRSL